MKAAVSTAASVDLAQIFTRHGSDWLESHYAETRHRKVMAAVLSCRTPALGGRCLRCDCGYSRYIYFSCRNRHCPQCQSYAKEQWRQDRQNELLPVPYFHQIFTLPHELNVLIGWSERNQRALLKLLFDAVAETLRSFGRNNLGGQLGFISVLHTWDQQLRPHYHLHCIVASGALTKTGRWQAGGSKYLFPVRALSKTFRRIYTDGLEQLFKEHEIDLPDELKPLSQWRRMLRDLRRKSWVVYSKRPFSSPNTVIDYLSRYTHRVGISNDRIKACDDDNVTFSYRDRENGNRKKIKSIPANTFISRFMKHVLPHRFMRIRHYGFLASRNKAQSLEKLRKLLGCRKPPQHRSTIEEWLEKISAYLGDNCPRCGKRLYEEELDKDDFFALTDQRRVRNITYTPYRGQPPP